MGVSQGVPSVLHRHLRGLFLRDPELVHVFARGERKGPDRPGHGGALEERVGLEDQTRGGVSVRLLFPADTERAVEQPARHMIVAGMGHARAGGAAGGDFQGVLAERAGRVHRPEVRVIDALEMFHVADEHRVNFGHFHLAVPQTGVHRLADQLHNVHIPALALMVGLAGRDYCRSSSHWFCLRAGTRPAATCALLSRQA